ncbi:MAG: archease [Candidatus Woesearchaeota archaeon]|jgi:SHS2 domain-containing protein|nr:archease [Candidatus Woesearchaeota archaeon]MDP7322530.1 archease [Candidatus Woesearchaeota archaeon]MDP7476062.1 archease [Candidatus Woesearchaeota archaeon]
MQKYKFLEHTADTKFQAYGNNMGEAFSNAALAMFSVITDTKKIKKKIKKEIKVKGTDLKSLLYNFLEELLFLLDTNSFLLNKIEKISIKKMKGKYSLNATVVGDKADNYETSGDIKAVTYNEMEIKENDKVMVQVVLDL